MESALTGRGKVEVRDGELRGEVNAFGVRLTVGRSTRRSGELVVDTLEGRFDISTLIDPGIKAADAADARRIKALVSIQNVLPSAELFYGLVGGREEFEKLIGTAALASEDLVVMAERIKRDLESKARGEESQAEHSEGRARGAREAAAGVDVKAEADGTALQGELEESVRALAALQEQQKATDKATFVARQAKDQLEDAEASYEGMSLADAKRAEEIAKGNESTAAELVRELEEKLSRANAAHALRRNEYSAAVQQRKQAEQHEALVAQWRQQIAASIPAAPTKERLDAAAARVTTARQAVECGALVRKAQQHLSDAGKHADEATGHRKRAEQLRTAAHGIDEVLSEVIAKSGSPLRVEHGRLVLTTRRGSTYYHDLSAGERARIAIDIGIEAVGEQGVLTLSQEIFEGLDPQNREGLARHAVERGVVILTAEASDDEEVTAEVFGSN